MKKLDGLMICTINRYIYVDDSKEIDINMLDMLDKMIKIYLEFKYEDVFIPLIVCKGTNRLIYSSEYKFKGGTRYVEIEEKNYKSFIKEMSMVDEWSNQIVMIIECVWNINMYRLFIINK